MFFFLTLRGIISGILECPFPGSMFSFLRADVRFWRPPSWAVLRHGSGSWRHESGPFHPLFLFLTLMFLFLTLQGIISGISRQSPHSPNVYFRLLFISLPHVRKLLEPGPGREPNNQIRVPLHKAADPSGGI